MLVCRPVLRIDDCAMLRAVDSDMVYSGGARGASVGYLFRLISTSIKSLPVWNTFEFAV